MSRQSSRDEHYDPAQLDPLNLQLPPELAHKTRLLTIVAGAFMTVWLIVAAILWWQGRHELVVHLDIPLHLYGGCSAALVFLLSVVALHGEDHLWQLKYWLRVVVVLGFTALVTIAWEFLEHFTDTWLGTNLQSTVLETLKDMAVGLLGAVPVAFWMTRTAKRRAKELTADA